jgi:hypothetical protein
MLRRALVLLRTRISLPARIKLKFTRPTAFVSRRFVRKSLKIGYLHNNLKSAALEFEAEAQRVNN